MSTSTTINRRPLDGHDLFDDITEQLERLKGEAMGGKHDITS